jgi:SAM-dependent methyltransferase
MRRLVGPTDPSAFDNPSGDPVYDLVPERCYESVLDFGCGCGRVARRLLLQRRVPERYVGLDLHSGMIRWCSEHLAPAHPNFTFHHHDIANQSFNPGAGKPVHAAFPVPDEWATLVVAHSVFTHILPASIEHYLAETARVLRPDGQAMTTWFLFDKRYFPMMQDEQNALFINELDPWNAVIYDRAWLAAALERHHLGLAAVRPPFVRGFQWDLVLAPLGDWATLELPESDDAPFGVHRAAADVADPHLIGNGAETTRPVAGSGTGV